MSAPWTRTRDRVIAAAIAVAVVAAALVVWATSDSRATSTSTADGKPPDLEAPADVPTTLDEVWRAANADSPEPVAEGSTVVTGNGGTVTGRDALTGKKRWHYQRDLPLCTVGKAWAKALAVYRKRSGCSEVTQLDMATGKRTAQRNGDAEAGARLIGDQSHVVTTGKKLINVWSQDLIRVMEYGDVPAPVNPGKQPRPGCSFGSLAADGGRIAMIERCPGEKRDRLTVIQTTNNEDGQSKSEEPKEVFSQKIPAKGGRVVAITGGERPVTAVAFGETEDLVIFGPDGKTRSTYSLRLPDADLRGDPDGGAVESMRTDEAVYWYTGSATIALDAIKLTPRWTLRDTLGPPVMYAGKLVVPIKGGLSVTDERTGESERTLSVDREGHSSTVRLGAAGPVLLEQRGTTLVALK